MGQRHSGGAGRAQEPESELIADSQRGDRDAFNQLVVLHQADAYALALRMLGNPDAAADVTQDAFFSAYRAIGSFRGTSFRAWLLRIVSNACFDTFRAQARRPAVSLEATLEVDRDAEVPGQGSDSRLPKAMMDASWDPEAIALRSEAIAQIQVALLKLPPEQRLALILSDIQGLAYEEIAQVMGTSLGTVKSRIARGRAHLRGLLLRQPELFGHLHRPGSGRGHDME
jgi:RNA polymerase sigma-70 factor (ECF subfamily)